MAFKFKYIILSFLLLGIMERCKFTPSADQITATEQFLMNGELSNAEKKAADILKKGELSANEKAKIDSILDISHRIRRDFTLSGSDVLKSISAYNPNADSAELLRLEYDHNIDVRVIDGRKLYFKSCIENIFRLDTAYTRLKTLKDGIEVDSLPIFRMDKSAETLRNPLLYGSPVNPVRMRLLYTLTVEADAVPEGDTIRCWMPYPREGSPRQQEIRLISTIPSQNKISPVSDLQRTVYLEKISVLHQPCVFRTEMEITSYAQSFQLSHGKILPYRKETAFYREFTSERKPQITFTNDIRLLAKNILQDETNPLLQVRRLYRWINDSVTWARALEYSIMPDIPGFVMKNRHGDCGMQTMLFMSLARYAGIPVKWQSGWMLHPGEVNLHDWCEVYYEGIGWVPLDQSFGLQNSTDEKIRDYYITGIDAYRLIVNDDFSRPLTPQKKYPRSEPYDFQRGEVEWKGGNLYFDKWSWHMDVTYN